MKNVENNVLFIFRQNNSKMHKIYNPFLRPKTFTEKKYNKKYIFSLKKLPVLLSFVFS